MARFSPFPPVDLNEALVIAKTIWMNNAGKPTRRLTIFDALKKSPDSSLSRALITASSGYGLTQGSYAAEFIKLTPRGQAIVEKNDPQSKLDAVLSVKVFSDFFTNYSNAIFPANNAAGDFLKGLGIIDTSIQACLELILKNGEQVCLVQEISGAKRIVTPEHALERLTKVNIAQPVKPLAETEKRDEQREQKKPPKVSETPPVIPITMNIQIVIPSDATAEKYDEIFSAIKKNLLKYE